MAYTPTEWQTGDVVTAEKLNKIESGIEGAGGVLIIEPTITHEGDATIFNLNASFNDIKNALLSGKNILVQFAMPLDSDRIRYAIRPFNLRDIDWMDGIGYTISFEFETPDEVSCSAYQYDATQDPDSDIVIEESVQY